MSDNIQLVSKKKSTKNEAGIILAAIGCFIEDYYTQDEIYFQDNRPCKLSLTKIYITSRAITIGAVAILFVCTQVLKII